MKRDGLPCASAVKSGERYKKGSYVTKRSCFIRINHLNSATILPKAKEKRIYIGGEGEGGGG
jgi:hypothetical protein